MEHGSIVFAGIAPHPPIMVPEVGGDAIVDVQSSIDGMRELTNRVIASGAETLILISPHAPLDATAFVAYKAPVLHGDFGRFRARETTVDAPLDEELLREIAAEAQALDYEVLSLGPYELDHGTAVPLYFLLRNGWHGRVVALGYSFLSNEDHLRFGACISRAVARSERNVALVASGDLSHRLKPEAPAGYNPDAHLFDEAVVAAINGNSPAEVAEIDPMLRKTAGECGYRSMLIAIGAVQDAAVNCEVLNYEAPFGVGYLVAQIKNSPAAHDDLKSTLPQLARRAVETYVIEGVQLRTEKIRSGPLAERAACFVSIKTLDGGLRGCIRTIEPQQDTLEEELIVNAISAAINDPRFRPVGASELANLKYSVDILSAPEPATIAELDPSVYGIIVESESGDRRGLLLPDIPGIDTIAVQVEITKRKAGILPDEPVKLFRFRVERYRETTGV